MVLSKLLVLLCLPNFGSKHPCLKGFINDGNEHCLLFERPRMYVQKRKYIPKDDFSFEAIVVYEDVMKQGFLELPWDALAAYTAPWDPQEVYVRRKPGEPYPITLESRKELNDSLSRNIPLKHIFMPQEFPANFGRKGNQNQYQRRIKSTVSYVKLSWPVLISFLFKIITKLIPKPSLLLTKQNVLEDDLKEDGVGTRKLLKAKRKLPLKIK